MGCCQTKHTLLISEQDNRRIICDLAARIAIDLISVYSDNTNSPLDIYMDTTQYLFGKRMSKLADINDKQVRVYILRYITDSPNQKGVLYDSSATPLEHLKEYLAIHNLFSYPVSIEYTVHDTGTAYFDVWLNNLN
jgi:hypothetical protein